MLAGCGTSRCHDVAHAKAFAPYFCPKGQRGAHEPQDEGGSTYLKLAIGPARNLNNHVEDGLLLVGIEGNIMEGRDGNAILLNVNSVLERVGGANLADLERGRHGGQRAMRP